MSVLVIGAATAAGVILGGLGGSFFARTRRPEPVAPVLVAPPASDHELQAALKAVPVPAMLVGFHDEVVCANDSAQEAGLVTGERLRSRTLLDLVRRVRREDEPDFVVLTIPRGVGVADLQLNTYVAPLDDGRVVVYGLDLQPQVRVDSARRDFIANVSHELKTPIGAIFLLSEALEEAADDPDAVKHFSGRLQVESKRLSDMVNQIINLSRLQSVHQLTGAEVVPVGEIVTSALSRVQVAADGRDISIRRTGDPNPEVEVEVGRLVDAVANLLQNAVAYSDPGGRVVVQTRSIEVDGRLAVEISVSDNGIGIKPEDQQRIFERFYRVDFARSRDTGGTGLGLSIVKHVAAAHGGDVSVWSALGQGSTFTLRLPAYRAGEPRIPLVESAQDASDPGVDQTSDPAAESPHDKPNGAAAGPATDSHTATAATGS